MRMWNILGIEPTDDTSAIKKAYASKLKMHHPEEDPEGYQRVREAYDWAMKHAKQQRKQVPVMTDVLEDDSQWDETWDDEDTEYTEDGYDLIDSYRSRGAEDHPVYAFMNKVKSLYEDYPKRNEPEAWIALLQDDLLWNVKHRETVSHLLLSYLEDHPHLPLRVWQILDEQFHWIERIKEDPSMEDLYDEDWLNAVQGRVQKPSIAYFSMPEALAGMAYDEVEHYLNCMETAFQALQVSDLEMAGDALYEAAQLYADDPERLHLQAEVEQRAGKYQDAVNTCNRGIELQPGNLAWYRSRAWNNYRNGDITKAIQDSEYLLEHAPDQVSVLTLLSFCHRERGELEKAEAVLLRILEIDRENPTAHIQLIEVRTAILEQLQKNKAPAAEVEARKRQTGHLPFSKQVKMFTGKALFGGTGILLRTVMIIIAHVWIHFSFIKHTGFSPLLFLSEVNQSVQWNDIPVRILIYLLILIWLYASLIRSAWRAYRFVRN